MGAIRRGPGRALAAALGLAIGCAGVPAAREPAGRAAPAVRTSASTKGAFRPSATAPRQADLASIEREVVARVNRYRRAEGLRPLSADPRVAEIARSHSRAMAAGRTRFGHGGFEGRTDAVAARVPYKRVAENVSRHRRHTRVEIPSVAVEKWLGSRGHRRNIEGPYAVTGVGAALAGDGSVYLTQIFVDPR
jgi:uncharacterized protein YkwD